MKCAAMGPIVGLGRVGGVAFVVGFVDGRAKSRQWSEKPHPLRGELQRRLGVIRGVGVRGRAGRGSRGCS